MYAYDSAQHVTRQRDVQLAAGPAPARGLDVSAREAPLGLAPLGLAPLGLAPLGLAPLGLAPLGLEPLRPRQQQARTKKDQAVHLLAFGSCWRTHEV